MGFNCLKAAEPLRGDSLLSTTKFPAIPGTHLIDFERMKDSRPWSHPVVLNTGSLHWESNALTTQSTSNDRELTGSQ